MPRGTRAIHGSEVDVSHHADTSAGEDVAMPASAWLPVSCWCQRWIVAVPQYEVRVMGITRSCGTAECRGEHEPVGPPRLGALLPQSPPADLDKWMGEHEFRAPRYPRKVTWLRHKPVQPHAKVAARRDLVAAAWQLYPKPKAIAERLGLDVKTVNNDLTRLRAAGRI